MIKIVFIVLVVAATATLMVNGDTSAYWVDGMKGDDSNPGSQDKPFKTITRARDTIRRVQNTTGLPEGGITVTVAAGDYDFTNGPLEFTSEDTGDVRSMITYRSEGWSFDGPGGARLTGGVKINWSEHISPVQDPVIKSLLKDPDGIVQVDLRKLGITDFGDLQSGRGLSDCANNKAELFSQSPDMTMVLARYPNIDATTDQWQWLSTGNVTDKLSFNFNTTSDAANRIRSWKNTSTLWLHGYWSKDWADNYVKVKQISPSNSTITVSSDTPPLFGFPTNARYYALNILEELDTENEYYIDRGSGILYLYESTARKLASRNKGCISVASTVLSITNGYCMMIEGFTIDCARSTAINISNNSYLIILYGTKVQDVGGQGISADGYNLQLTVNVTRTGCGGVGLTSGDRMTLESGNSYFTDSHISYWSNWKRTYTPGVSWGGVGNTFQNNTITNGPHAGILGGGNDCIFEGNTLDTLCYETADSGGFYTGRTWIDRGNVIRGNTFRNIRSTETTHLGYPGIQAIYLDDMMSGYTVENNTFYNCDTCSFIGGGRRNTIRNNTYHYCNLCTHMDGRGLARMKSYCAPDGQFEQQLKSVNYQHPPWSTRYPELVNIMNDHPCEPVYNVIEDNKCCNSKQFINVPDGALKEWMTTVQNNTVTC